MDTASLSRTDTGLNGTSSSIVIPAQDADADRIYKILSDNSDQKTVRKPEELVDTIPRILKRIKEENREEAMKRLRDWMPEKRRNEVDHELVDQIRKLNNEEGLKAIKSLKGPRTFISGNKSNQLEVPVTLQTVDTLENFRVKGLIDSGCTRSCIGRKFVEEYGIKKNEMPIPTKVYNADGTLNTVGAITHFVELRMMIGDHSEKIHLAVADLGKANLFIGHEWLKCHNPTIDWQEGKIIFEKCPSGCGYKINYTGVDQDLEEEEMEEDWTPNLEEGDRLFMMDWEGYINIRKLQEEVDYVKEYQDVFEQKEFDQLPERRPWDHAIELTPGAKPSDCKVYPLCQAEQRALDEFLEENLKTGRIRDSKSPMAAPFFFVKKKDGKLRPVQDYRKLNKITIKNKYPLPLIQELVDKLKQARIFTKLDIRWGYNNIRIKEGDEWKAAFRTNRGLFEPTVMFFGLTNSPATFQGFMNEIFRELINEGHVVVYMDDILIFTENQKEHQKVVRRVLDILKENRLFLKPEKCSFEQESVEYLGLIVGGGRIKMDPKKVEAVSDWPKPKNKKGVQAFLGFCNFYRRFIQGFSGIAKPLTILTGNLEWKWEKEQDEAFEKLKNALVTMPILAIPVDGAPFRLEADSSDFAQGGILSQYIEGKWHPVAYRSKSLSETERNYEIYDKEMLAIMSALEEWRQYLMGTDTPFEIWTDHQNLQYFRKPQKLNRRQARWITELAEYNFKLIHKLGSQMGKADALSRRTGHETGKDDNENLVMLKPEFFQNLVLETPSEDIIKRIKQTTENADRVVKMAVENKEKGWKKHEDGLVTWQDRIYVPIDSQLREKIIRLHHDSLISGHLGRYKTQELITRNYWWPGLQRDIQKYITGCDSCQKTKVHRQKPHSPLNPNEVPSRPWEVVTVDLIGELPESKGFNAICVVVDRFTKQIHLVPTHTTLTAEGMAKIYRDNIFRLHGIPRKIIHDRGTQFEAKFMKEFYKLVGIEANASTAYHPQTDGQTERMNQEVEHYLRVQCGHLQDDWSDWLAMAEFSYNNKEQSATGISPFFANHGQHPNTGLEPRVEYEKTNAGQFVEKMEKVKEETKAALERAADEMRKYYNRKRNDAPEIKTGDKVLLEVTNIKTDRPMKKLGDLRYGPFKVLEKIGRSSYKLELPKNWRVHPVFNEVLLTPYAEPEFPSQIKELPPPPDIINNEIEYEVEEVLDSRIRKRGRKEKIEYYVKWKGYDVGVDAWQPEENLENAKDLIEKFHKKYQKKPGQKIVLQKLEIPMDKFPKELFRKLYEATEPIDEGLPTELELHRMTFRVPGKSHLKRGVML